VFCLGQQIRGDEIGARLVIGDHHHFGHAGRQIQGSARGILGA
jgi:hypothetical protein